VDGRVGLRIKASSALDLRREALEERLRFAIHAHRPSQAPVLAPPPADDAGAAEPPRTAAALAAAVRSGDAGADARNAAAHVLALLDALRTHAARAAAGARCAAERPFAERAAAVAASPPTRPRARTARPRPTSHVLQRSFQTRRARCWPPAARGKRSRGARCSRPAGRRWARWRRPRAARARRPGCRRA
jgi:hypothetical protein